MNTSSNDWRAWRRYKRNVRIVLVLVLAGVVTLGAVRCDSHQEAAPAAAAVSPRECAARAVYVLASDDWGQRAMVANAVLNQLSALGSAAPCPYPLPSGSEGLSSYRMRTAFDAVDAVASGSYAIVPLACARATAVTPSAAVPRAQCVYGELAFTGGDA